MLKREKIMSTCRIMFLIGVIGLELSFIIPCLYKNIMCGISIATLCLIIDSVVLYAYLDLKEL